MLSVEQIKPVGDQVLLHRERSEQILESGLILPETKIDKSMNCKVLAVGSAVTEIRKDEIVKTMPYYRGQKINVNEVMPALVPEGQIYAVVRAGELIPLGSRVLISKEEDSDDKFTPDGLIIKPDNVKEKPQIGTILAVGPGDLDEKKERSKMEVSIGDRVVFNKYEANLIEHNGKQMLICQQLYCLAKVDDVKN